MHHRASTHGCREYYAVGLFGLALQTFRRSNIGHIFIFTIKLNESAYVHIQDVYSKTKMNISLVRDCCVIIFYYIVI